MTEEDNLVNQNDDIPDDSEILDCLDLNSSIDIEVPESRQSCKRQSIRAEGEELVL